MDFLWFLIVPLLVTALATAVIYLRGRRPTTLRSGIDDFRQEMDALSPGANSNKSRRFEADGTSQPNRRTGT